MIRAITTISVAALTVAAALTAGGCNGQPAAVTVGELQQCRRDIDALQRQVNGLQQELRDSRRQIETLQDLGEKRLDLLYHVVRIELGRYTGGYDADGKPGDDGIRVYFEPVDADSHPIKASGSATVQLFDLAAPAESNLLAEYPFDVNRLRKHWYGSFLSYHYRLDCPWKSGPPDHRDVTVRVTFTDYLTGRSFTAQKVAAIRLPTETQPAK